MHVYENMPRSSSTGSPAGRNSLVETRDPLCDVTTIGRDTFHLRTPFIASESPEGIPRSLRIRARVERFTRDRRNPM